MSWWGAYMPASARPKTVDPTTPRFIKQARIEQFMKEASEEWQTSHDLLEWLLMDEAHLRTVYAHALVDFVETLVGETKAEAA